MRAAGVGRNPKGPMNFGTSTVAVYIVTYRRHHMLKRSIASVLAQTHRDLALYVVNDDPGDQEVARIVASFCDPRARMFEPVEKRGPTRNFNLVFQERDVPFSALLEDDNWWEPTFLESQIRVLEHFRDAPVVVGNERIWKELPGGSWQDTGRTIWPFGDVRLHEVTLESLCGGAKLCNSSMLVRTQGADQLLTPDFIPVDVTEHYRERLMPRTFPLNGEPLVNYAETNTTARSKGRMWELQQIALIGSVFIALPGAASRRALARSLWRTVGSSTSPRATTLVGVGIAVREARALVTIAPVAALARSALGYVRHPFRLGSIKCARYELEQPTQSSSANWREFTLRISLVKPKPLASNLLRWAIRGRSWVDTETIFAYLRCAGLGWKGDSCPLLWSLGFLPEHESRPYR